MEIFIQILFNLFQAANFAVTPFFHTWFWFSVVGYVLCFILWFAFWGVCSSGASFCSDLQGSFTSLDSSWEWQFTMIIVSSIVLGLLASYWFHKVSYNRSFHFGSSVRQRLHQLLPRLFANVLPKVSSMSSWLLVEWAASQ